VLAANLAILRSRFPRAAAAVECVETPAYNLSASPNPAPVVDGRQVVSGVSPTAEARRQAAALRPRAPLPGEVTWCYGTGLGSLPRALLERADVGSIAVVPLSVPLLRLAMSFEGQRDWLSDPRIDIVLADKVPRVHGPFTVSAGELAQARPMAHALRDELEIALNRNFHRVQFLSQFEDDKANLLEAVALGDEHVSLLLERERRPGRYVVCAGGPTLTAELSWLAEERRRDPSLRVVAVNTAVPALARAGLAADYVVALDGHPDTLRQVDGVDLSGFAGAALVYDRVVPLGYMRRWPGRRAWALTGPDCDLWADGTVTHAATDLAVKLGATEVTLLGADFCYAHGRTHHTAVFHSAEVEDGPAMRHTTDGEGRDVLTISSLVHMRRRLERYIEAHPGVAFVKRGRAGVSLEGARWAA
jgi:hypothetical protein